MEWHVISGHVDSNLKESLMDRLKCEDAIAVKGRPFTARNISKVRATAARSTSTASGSRTSPRIRFRDSRMSLSGAR